MTGVDALRLTGPVAVMLRMAEYGDCDCPIVLTYRADSIELVRVGAKVEVTFYLEKKE